MEFKDYYKIMGLDKKASAEEIKRAYRKLARKYHPDVSKEAGAETKFKDVNEAYDVLKDPEKRKAYDQLGANWKAGQQFNPNDFDFSQFKGAHGFQGFDQGAAGAQDFGDFFENLFGGGGGRRQRQRHHQPMPATGEDLHVTMTISLEDAFQGANKTVQLNVPEVQQGQWAEVPKTLKIKIPAGIADGQQIRLAGQGSPGLQGGGSGDLYIKIHLQPHPRYRVEGKDLYAVLPISPWEAALGASIAVPTLKGALNVKIPVGAHSGQKLRLKACGLPGKTEEGALFLELLVQTPAAKTEGDRAAYEAFSQAFSGFNPRQDLTGG